ncbi:MAG: cobyric acid synthase CobQ [Methylobacter sp.]|nr:MAG: cobyric acid synthase CobQ [Methylobacter sp.]
MHPLTVFGTGSDAGKTTLVMALCRIFSRQGLRVAPFKAQNVSNNSAVTRDGLEIARAQYLQAQAAGVEASHLFNPVLLKSQGSSSVQVIVNGQVYRNQSVAGYYADIDDLKHQVAQSFQTLLAQYDLVIAEGAGSPVELNLLEQDLSNTFIATTFESKNILVADIERGGVFAAIYGTLALLSPALRANLIGVVINKFRGDRKFFADGRTIIEQRFGLPVLGVLPFQPLNIDMEDSQSLLNYQQRFGAIKIRIAVIAYPGLSNFNDLDPLMADPELEVELIHAFRPLEHFDMVLLPGSKTVIRDLKWLKQSGLFNALQAYTKPLFGLCGGYQMLCRTLHDPQGLEHDTSGTETGLALIDDDVHYSAPKILKRGSYRIFSLDAIEGYEIHCGRLSHHPLWYQHGRIAGTHVHGVFENDAFRAAYFGSLNTGYQGYDFCAYREDQIHRFTDMVNAELDVTAILKALSA